MLRAIAITASAFRRAVLPRAAASSSRRFSDSGGTKEDDERNAAAAAQTSSAAGPYASRSDRDPFPAPNPGLSRG